MGRLETFVVNSPFRAPFARQEVARFRSMAALVRGLRVLEVGCGAGLTTKAIADALRPSHLSAFDFSQDQVARAHRRLNKYADVEIRQADATRMPYEDACFDAVLEIGILHHVPRWREALSEVARVLRPSGTFCFAEPTKGRLTRGMYRMFPHPPEAMFEKDELLEVFGRSWSSPEYGPPHPALEHLRRRLPKLTVRADGRRPGQRRSRRRIRSRARNRRSKLLNGQRADHACLLVAGDGTPELV